ncbi:hypothetical protein V8F20_004030 [Naviculisporaceae sp. PSN 640]
MHRHRTPSISKSPAPGDDVANPAHDADVTAYPGFSQSSGSGNSEPSGSGSEVSDLARHYPPIDHNTDQNVLWHGWRPVAADANAIFKGRPYLRKPRGLLVRHMDFPADGLLDAVHNFFKKLYPPATYNHCMRVYYFALTILSEQFQDSDLSKITLALACLFHPIDDNPDDNPERNPYHIISFTQNSFELRSACMVFEIFLFFEWKLGFRAKLSEAEAVIEAVARQQDIAPPGSKGNITYLGQILQLARMYDNVGAWPGLISPETRHDVEDNFPRLRWTGLDSQLAEFILAEVMRKPWCISSKLCTEEHFNRMKYHCPDGSEDEEDWEGQEGQEAEEGE